MLGDSIDPASSFNLTFEGDKEWITTVSVYVQEKFQVDLLKGLFVTLGARNDYGFSNSFKYNQLSPRIGLVQKLSNKFNLKMLYGKALRTPNIKIVGINNETNNLIEEFQPTHEFRAEDPVAEVISSYDFGVNYTARNISCEAVVFYNSTQNELTRRTWSSDGDPSTQVDDLESLIYVTNIDGSVDGLGYELSLKYIPRVGMHFFANHSYAKAEDNSEDNAIFNFAYIPLAKTNLGGAFAMDAKQKLVLSPIVRVIHGLRIDETNTDGKTYIVGDLNVRYQPTKKVGLEVQLRDAFDTEPSSYSHVVIPSRGRRVVFTLGFSM
jgi:outer membrane receptor protein involved in Fe transport